MKVVLNNLTKVFPNRDKKDGKGVVAVNDFNFEFPDGKLVGLLGPSGCGKSTTLYMISGLHTPSKGQIYFGSWNKDFKKDGFGININPDGSIYKGFWSSDFINKEGIYIDNDGNYYKNELKNGLLKEKVNFI